MICLSPPELDDQEFDKTSAAAGRAQTSRGNTGRSKDPERLRGTQDRASNKQKQAQKRKGCERK